MAVFKVFKTPEDVARAVADYLYQQIKNCVAKKARCNVVLPGGTTPARCLELLAEKSLPWNKIHWYPGDERCYPAGHAERNDTMITEKLFSQKAQAGKNVPTQNLHVIPAELGPEKGAEKYADVINSITALDIVVLGMGEDGHTASLFPDNIALEDPRSVVPVYQAPKPPAERISIGLNKLRDAGECIVIATGGNKREALTKLNAGALLPVVLVKPDTWFLDRDADPMSERKL